MRLGSAPDKQGGGMRSHFQGLLLQERGPRLLLLIAVTALVLMGLVMIFSASSIEAISRSGSPFLMIKNQLIFVGVGVFICWVVSHIDYHLYETRAVMLLMLVGMYVLLLLVALIGTKALGAQRWVNIGPFSLQPSEFAKVIIILAGAYAFQGWKDGILTRATTIGLALGGVIIPLSLILVQQSDLGSTMIIIIGLLTVLWVGGVSFKVFLGAAAVVGLMALIAIFGTSYRSGRMNFLNPWEHADTTGYQLIHSFFAFSEGGLLGVGLGNSHEKFQYLPEAQTDFIYSIIGEELGLIGTLLVLVLFVAILYAGMRIAHDASDSFGMSIAASLTVMIVFQAFLNMYCVLGLAPTTGKPLPFLSYGGSSIMASLIMVGIIMNVARVRESGRVYERRREELRVVPGGRAKSSSAGSSSSHTPLRNTQRSSGANSGVKLGGASKSGAGTRSTRSSRSGSGGDLHLGALGTSSNSRLARTAKQSARKGRSKRNSRSSDLRR